MGRMDSEARMANDVNTYSPPLLYKNTRTGLLFFILALTLVISTQFLLFHSKWYVILPFLLLYETGCILYLLGIMEIISDSKYYEDYQKGRLNNALLLIVVSLVMNYINTSVAAILLTIAVGLIIYNWLPKGNRPLVIACVMLSFIQAAFRFNSVTYDHSTESETVTFHAGYYIAGAIVILIYITQLYVYLELYRAVKPLPIPLYPLYQQPPLATPYNTGSQVVPPTKLCPFCKGELEPEWRICHHCKKVLRER